MTIAHPPLTVKNTQSSQLKAMLMLAVMLLAVGAAVFLKPTHDIAKRKIQINLEAMIPKQFGQWQIDDSLAPLLVSPDKQAVINKIYNQTLSRTYVSNEGKRIMLSIAYGGDQSDAMQVHKPEVCYAANGFQVQGITSNILNTGYGLIPTKRLLATKGLRVEPITYWITVGDTVVANGFKQKLAQLKYGLTGKVPDGLLFRVSSIGDEYSSYTAQEDFIKVFLSELTSESRRHIIGELALKTSK